MNRRVRSLIALLALTGFTAIFAESLLAMSCMSADTMEHQAFEPEAASSPMHDGMDHPAPTSPGPYSDAEVPQHCPLAMAGSSCAASASLPVARTVSPAPVPSNDPSVVDLADAAHELIVRPLFHPPKS